MAINTRDPYMPTASGRGYTNVVNPNYGKKLNPDGTLATDIGSSALPPVSNTGLPTNGSVVDPQQAKINANLPGSLPNLQGNPDFDKLAASEFAKYGEMTDKNVGDINTFSNQYKDLVSSRRADLARSLTSSAQNQFEQENPFILEDLNSRGFSTSPTATAAAQAQALAGLSAENNRTLTNFDTNAYSSQDEILGQALNSRLQGRNDQYNSLFDLGRSKVQGNMDTTTHNQDLQLANDLAAKKRRTDLLNTVMNLGGTLTAAEIGKGGLGSLFGSTAATGSAALGSSLGLGSGATSATGLGATSTGALSGTSVASGVHGTLGLAPGSTLPSGAASSTGSLAGFLAGAGGGSYLGQKTGNQGWYGAKSKGAQKRARAGATIGATTGAAIGHFIPIPGASVLAGLVGGQYGSAIGGLTKSHAAGEISKAAKRMFCFEATTPIIMADGSTRSIKDMWLGDRTKGGIVESLRMSTTSPGTRYKYDGIIVTGSHAVLEDGTWKRVEDAKQSVPLEGGGVVYSLVTTGHRIYINDTVFADEHETDQYETISINESLAELNRQELAVA